MYDIQDVSKWIDSHTNSDGRLSDDNHNLLVKTVQKEELPLIIFFDKSTNGWVVALDEPNLKPFETYWFYHGIMTRAEAIRIVLGKFEDHTKYRVIK